MPELRAVTATVAALALAAPVLAGCGDTGKATSGEGAGRCRCSRRRR